MRVVGIKDAGRLLTFLASLALLVMVCAACVPEAAKVPLPKDGNEPFMFEREGPKQVLLIHGLRATPWEVRPLGEYLAKQKITVVAPLLAAHGSSAFVLSRSRWQDWYGTANDTLTTMLANGKRTYVVGVSGGGDIALLLAQEHTFDGLVLIAPPITLRDKRVPYAWLYKYLLPFPDRPSTGADIGHYADVVPSNAIAELNKMIEKVKLALPQITESSLVLQSLDDQTVHPSSASYIFYNLGSQNKEWRLYGNASHVIVQEEDAPDIVFTAVADFLRRN